jgi:hypothetical protein
MSNFVQIFNNGVQGKNAGLPTGISVLDRALDRIQRGSIYGIAGSPKTGKSTLTDHCFLINPYLDSVENNTDVDFIYYSLEMSRVKIEYKVAAFFFYHDYEISDFKYTEGTYKKYNRVPVSPRYLLHKLRDDNNNIIHVIPEHKKILKEIYEKRIVPMFGRYDTHGRKISKGKIEVIEDRNDSNPTGIRNYLLNYAKRNGEFVYEPYETVVDGKTEKKQRVIGYKPNNPDKFTIVILDHLRKMKLERGYKLKENMDKMLEYQVFLRNICGMTFVDIIHLNRNISDINRIKFNNEFLFPNDSDLKDSGNLSEEADFLITVFNPHDERYNITKHFGIKIDEYPNYRSIHLVQSRDTECPVHMQLNAFYNISYFEPL